MSQPPKPPFGTANFDDAVVVESVTYSTDVTASFGDEVSTR
jgi:hypothetical protein